MYRITYVWPFVEFDVIIYKPTYLYFILHSYSYGFMSWYVLSYLNKTLKVEWNMNPSKANF